MGCFSEVSMETLVSARLGSLCSVEVLVQEEGKKEAIP